MDSRTDEPSEINTKLRVLLIDDNVVPLTLAVTRCLGIAKNTDIHILNLNGLLFPSFRFSKYVKSYTRGKVNGDKDTYSLIRNTSLMVKADIIIPVKEKTVRIVTERLDRLLEFTHVPPMPQPQVLDLVRNKWLLYNWLFEKKLLAEKPKKYAEVVRSDKIIQELIFPLLIKPFWGSGGRGIVKIRDREELINFKPGKAFNIQELLIQNFIHGYDIDISALTDNGKILAYSIQKNISGSNKLVYSKSIEFMHLEILLEQAAIIFRELNYSGIAHLDFRYDEITNTYQLIDFNARYWSSLLGSLSCGINFPWLACQKAMKRPLSDSVFSNEKYFATNNPLKIIFKHIPGNKTEFQYTVRDPAPFIIDLFNSAWYHFKKIFIKQD
jgi:D-aspartate ligase